MHFLFPSDPLQPQAIDELFEEQAQALTDLGFGVSLVSLEALALGKRRPLGVIPAGETVCYRGWMLSDPDYERLIEAIRSRDAEPLTSVEAYLAAHHLPRWYPRIPELTAETRVFPADADLAAEIEALGWGTVFLKDYVKSLKTSVGSVVSKPQDAATVVAEMEKFRGEIEGGICVRRFERYREGSERRYFVLRGVPHAADGGAIPAAVEVCAQRIESPFFSVDVAVRDDGVERVVEVGDGQVSDLVGWSPQAFAQIWQEDRAAGLRAAPAPE